MSLSTNSWDIVFTSHLDAVDSALFNNLILPESSEPRCVDRKKSICKVYGGAKMLIR